MPQPLCLRTGSYRTGLAPPIPPPTKRKKKKNKEPDEDSQILELSECEMSTKTLRLRPRVVWFFLSLLVLGGQLGAREAVWRKRGSLAQERQAALLYTVAAVRSK
jgi:hypothetical protein